ncbi:MAG: VacJ family lipoprotein [Gammaproteobacteria bacterium]|nr:VacJ family lipoprotein [Gammaproteobacteria bacterium]
MIMKQDPFLVSLRESWAILFLAFCVMGLSACATSGQVSVDDEVVVPPDTAAVDHHDPLEKFNRAMYKFNDFVDENALKPVAKGYKAVTPNVVRKGVGNFFSNLMEPIVIINDLLQFKFEQMASDTARFLFNTTVGIGGLIDVATPMDLRKHDEDFGQTFGKWGVGPGPYLVLPFLGPRNLRDAVGWGADQKVNPINYIEPPRAKWTAWSLYVVDTRTQLLGTKDILEQAAGEDPYIFVREAYRQKRQSLVYDGNPPIDDELLFE